MNRFAAGFSVLFLICFSAVAQNPAPVPDSDTLQPAVTTSQSPEILQFQKIEDTWSSALNRRDQFALELVLSPLFVDVAANGDITTRSQQIAQLITTDDPTFHLQQRLITVRMLGDIAVANGTYALHHKVGSAEMEQKGVFTQVFERVRGGWQCVNSQRTEVHEPPSVKHKKQPGADTPFHFPLFGKSDKDAH